MGTFCFGRVETKLENQMTVYGWLHEENGKEMLSFLEELGNRVSTLPALGSLAVGMGKCVGDYIRLKSAELKIPADEAIAYFQITMKK